MTGRKLEDPPQPDPIQTGSHHLGYHCSYHRGRKSAPPILVPAEEVERIYGHCLLLIRDLHPFKPFVPLKERGRVHPSPDEGRLQTSHAQTGQISGCSGGLVGCIQKELID